MTSEDLTRPDLKGLINREQLNCLFCFYLGFSPEYRVKIPYPVLVVALCKNDVVLLEPTTTRQYSFGLDVMLSALTAPA